MMANTRRVVKQWMETKHRVGTISGVVAVKKVNKISAETKRVSREKGAKTGKEVARERDLEAGTERGVDREGRKTEKRGGRRTEVTEAAVESTAETDINTSININTNTNTRNRISEVLDSISVTVLCHICK